MIDHLSIGVGDIESAANFYDQALGVLGYKRHVKFDDIVAYGDANIRFLAILPFGSHLYSPSTGIHIAFKAPSKAHVDQFYRVTMNGGGECEGRPGLRDYPRGQVYTTYIRDPFGNKLEAIFESFNP